MQARKTTNWPRVLSPVQLSTPIYLTQATEETFQSLQYVAEIFIERRACILLVSGNKVT
jgi:hypothetical protein